jgi:superoxide dismutase
VICNSINALLDKITKEGKEPKTFCNKTKALSNKLQNIEEEIIVELKGKLSQKGWQRMKPAYVFARLITKPMMKKNKVTKKEIEDLSKRIRSHFNSMKTQKKNWLAKLLKKSIV